MPKCSYCGKTYPEHKGLIVVDSTAGNMKFYCSSKCRKNAEMKRKKRKWSRMKKGE
jgi:ribosomal protein L24E